MDLTNIAELTPQVLGVSNHPADIQIHIRSLAARMDFVQLYLNTELAGEITELRKPLMLLAE